MQLRSSGGRPCVAGLPIPERPILIEDLLYKPTNSLVVQSLHSQLGAETTNGDGFGVGWYCDQPTPGVFRSTEPAWNDRNLHELASQISSRRVLAHIRASTGSPVQQTNCHPFRHGRWLMMHNGYIGGLHEVRRDLILAIDPALFPEIEGTTDTELLFHLALTYGLEDDPPAAMARAVGLVEEIGRRRGVRVPDPDDRGHHGRRDDVGLPLLQQGPVAVAVPQHRRVRAPRAVPGQPVAARGSPTTPGSSSPSPWAT